MPTRPWKKTITVDGLLSGLRSKGSGSLVVQTGFPTSLADLIVKNHGRLRKASRKNKEKPLPTSDLSTAEGGAATQCPVLGCRSSDPVIDITASADRSTKILHGFWFLMGSLILYVALVTWEKKLVIWITISAFSLLLLELYVFRGRGFMKPCLDARKMLESVFGILNIRGREAASPIREISVGFRVGSCVPGGKREELRIPDQCGELFVESRDHAEVCRKGKLETFVDCKAKKLLRKFMLNKSHGARGDGKLPRCIEATEDGLSEKDLIGKGDEEGVVQSFKACYDDFIDGEETFRLHSNVDGNKLGRCSQFVFFLIVLCGLVRGKTVALLLALAWCFFFKFIQVMRDKGKMR